MHYLLNSAVITGPGTYTYQLATAEEAARWLQDHPWVSRVGYPATAAHIEKLCGNRPPLSRDATAMRSGDEALVVRLKYRISSPDQKQAHVPGPDDWEYGILKKK